MPIKQALHLKVLSVTKPSQLESAADGFYLDRQANHCTESTLVYYRKYFGALVSWLAEQGITDPGAVTATHLRSWLVELQGRELAEWTVRHHAAAAKAFFNFCVAEELIAASPMSKVKLPRLPKEILPAFDTNDIHRLLDACSSLRDKAIVLCLLDTGCRAAEFIAFNIESINLNDGSVTIKQGKGRKDRMVFIGSKARKALWRYLKERPGRKVGEPLWLSEKTGERLKTGRKAPPE